MTQGIPNVHNDVQDFIVVQLADSIDYKSLNIPKSILGPVTSAMGTHYWGNIKAIGEQLQADPRQYTKDYKRRSTKRSLKIFRNQRTTRDFILMS